MKKFLVISLLLNGVLASALLWRDPTAQAALGPAGPAGNGDVDGDGYYTVNDAVSLLTWMFLGGPAPKTIPYGQLPTTGQTDCYSQSKPDQWTIFPCSKAPGQDGFYESGCPSEGRFTDNGDGTVTDQCTLLMWQKETADANGDGVIDGHDAVLWGSGIIYCNKLNFAGHDDWRLPNVKELLSIVDYGKFNPSIDPGFGIIDYGFWSSTAYAYDPNYVWTVFFSDGSAIHTYGRSTDWKFVRAVRNAR